MGRPESWGAGADYLEIQMKSIPGRRKEHKTEVLRWEFVVCLKRKEASVAGGEGRIVRIVNDGDFVGDCKHFGFTLSESGSYLRVTPGRINWGVLSQRVALPDLTCVSPGSLWLL